ncbi:hypothetical protein E4U58_003795 [Claviceps cyperi]|nr:hypothetical protein E4U58_003795 [Claviceps cyperi]
MRILTALGFACGALAVAIGSVQSSKNSLTVDGEGSPDLKNAVATHEITHQDEELSSFKFDKRTLGRGAQLSGLQLPTKPNPEPLIIAGVTVTFIMATRWVRAQGTNLMQYYVKTMAFRNQNSQRIAIQAFANGANFLSFSTLGEQGVQSQTPPDGVQTFSLSVAPVHTEL